MALQPEREFQLGADAVGARDEHGFSVLPGNLRERAETADSGEHLRAQRFPGEGLDRFDQRIARVDVHPRVAVADRLLAGQDLGLQLELRARFGILIEMPSPRLACLD